MAGKPSAKDKGLTGRQKAALLLISLGPETSAQVFKHLRDDEIEQLTLDIANVNKVNMNEKETILKEFHQICVAKEYISQGGINYAKEILEKALGSEKASAILSRLKANLHVRPFDFARNADPSQLFNFLQSESTQTIALVLSHFDPPQAAMILSNLPHEKRADVAKRMAIMDSTSPEVVNQIEMVLEQKLSSSETQDYTKTGGIENIVQVLNNVDRGTERSILDTLEIQDPDLAEEIKKRMFVFEDIVILDDKSVQRVIRDVENQDLMLSLKVASEEVKQLIFRNISKRMVQTFQEEMEYMGPVRLKDVEEAQTRIVAIIRKLEEDGEIVVSRGADDGFV